MREFSSTFNGFNEGLRPTTKVAKNTETLISAINFKPVAGGLQSIEEPINLADINDIWPFPQLFKTSDGIIVAGSTRLWRLNNNNTVTEILSGINPGTWWSFADYSDYILGTNGADLVFLNPATGNWTIYAAGELPVANSLCDFNGQLIFGGLPAGWETDGGENFVAWSKIGYANAELDEGNVSGLAPMPWDGAVYQVMKLGQHAMVYGEKGICPMMPASSPVAGYGFPNLEMFPAGIAGGGAVCGDQGEHYFLSSAGHLFRITDNHAITRFGYREFFEPMLDTDISMSFDKERRIVYIFNEDTGYILTPNGLGGPMDIVISSTLYDDFRHGLIVGVPGSFVYDEAIATIEPTDFGIRAIKNTGWMEVTQTGVSDVECRVDAKFSKATNVYVPTAYVPTNQENAAFVRQAGTDLKITTRFTNFDEVLFSKLWYAIQTVDNRFTRGSRGGRGVKE